MEDLRFQRTHKKEFTLRFSKNTNRTLNLKSLKCLFTTKINPKSYTQNKKFDNASFSKRNNEKICIRNNTLLYMVKGMG